MKSIELLNDLFIKAADYRNYRLANKNAPCDYSVASKTHWPKKLDGQIMTHSFSGQDPIAILRILARFKTACDHSRAGEGAAV